MFQTERICFRRSVGLPSCDSLSSSCPRPRAFGHSASLSRRHMKIHAPISAQEFLDQFLRCVPSASFAWTGPLAVATSGGPDSTCLLFLLKQLLSEVQHGRTTPALGVPTSLLAVNVDHNLQEASAEMSRRSANISEAIGVPHTTIRIRWGRDNFPSLKNHEEGFENVARVARYQAIWSALQEQHAPVVAFGHHVDDQLETVLMRIGRGTGKYGAAGMTPFRRWGAGWSKRDSGQYGSAGLNTWIFRPLLQFSKARILATCDAHRLEYVTDKTNFQPNLTYRNAIRHWLANKTPGSDDLSGLSANMREHISVIIKQNNELGLFDLSTSTSDLVNTVHQLAQDRTRVENEVTQILQHSRRPSPPSSLVLQTNDFGKITDEAIQTSIITRVLRYVSPHPFGSLAAQAGRRTEKLELARLALFRSKPHSVPHSAFQCGARVAWRPVTIRPYGDFVHRPAHNSDEEPGWLLHRAKPGRYDRFPVESDLTDIVHTAAGEGLSTATFEFDSRFELSLDIHAMTEELGSPIDQYRFFVEGAPVYCTPRVWACSTKGHFTEFRIRHLPDLERTEAENMLLQLQMFLPGGQQTQTPRPKAIVKLGQPPLSRFAHEWGLRDGSTPHVTVSSKHCVSARFFRLLITANM